ncbi:hypothetical protein Tco_1248788 [Tanacetum coccineum]
MIALMDANKKVDLENPLCLEESIILADILKIHPLRFSIVASSSVPWIYLGQLWDTLHEHRSKYTLKFMLDRKELTLTLDDFKTIFHLTQATDNNHDHFVPAPTFSEMVQFYINDLGFTLELRSTSNFKTTGLLQPWQTLCKIFTKLILSHYMTAYLEISRRVRDRYHNLADDVMIKSIFNLGKSKGIHRTNSAPRSPNPVVAEGESSAPRRSTVIRLHTLQVSLAEQKSHEELEATQNVEKVKEHLMTEEIEKLVKGSKTVEENVEVNSSPLKNDDNQTDPGTRSTTFIFYTIIIFTKIQALATNRLLSSFKAQPGRFRRYKSFFQEIQGRYGYLFEHLSAKSLPRRKFNELTKNPEDIMMESLPKLVDDRIKVDSPVRSYMTGHILHVHPAKDTPSSTQEQQYQLYLAMKYDPQLQKDDVSIWLALKIKFERLQVAITPCRPSAVRPRDQDDPHDDAHPEGENSVKRQKTTEHGTFELVGSSSGQEYKSEPGLSTSGNQEQSDDFDFWKNSYAIDDDVIPNERVSQ